MLSTHELAAPGFLPVLVERGVLKLLDCMTAREQTVISDILIKLPSLGGAYNGEDLQAGIDLVTKGMDDLMCACSPKLRAQYLQHVLSYLCCLTHTTAHTGRSHVRLLAQTAGLASSACIITPLFLNAHSHTLGDLLCAC